MKMKIVIRDLESRKYFRKYSDKTERLNDWVKDLCDATLLDEQPGFEIVKILRDEGYKITFIAVKDMVKYERLTKLQRDVKRLVKQAIKHRVGIVELVESKVSTGNG